ncbi:MAG TPA: polysaccharide deacetylase family protein [Gemmataceae bacterium]|jgi:peptidoglycan/xylan/chitin deacetylase (PgdA/CDA1 family)
MVSMRSLGDRIVRQAYRAGYRVLPRLLQPSARGPLVLLYHSVEDACDVWTNRLGINITPRRFEDHVRFLTENFRVVPFAHICRADAAPDEIAITFDDGYASITNAVLPIVEKYRCPIKVYVTTENLTEINWLNKLCYLLNVLSLAELSALAEAALGVPTHRPVRRRDFIDHFDPERTPPAIDDFFHRAYRGGARRLYLTVEEVRQLAAHPLVEIGSHTRRHYPLTRLDAARLREEVVENHWQLNRLFDNKVQGFAIPFGYRTHRTPEIVAAIGEVDAFVVSAYGGRLDFQACHGLPEVKRIGEGGNLGALWYCLRHPN